MPRLSPYAPRCFLDSPLSDLGLEQCHSLQAFLRNPCLDPAAQPDFDVLTAGEGRSVIVSSQLRRAAATAAIGLADRLKRTNEPILMHSSCQEISRNFDTISITEARTRTRTACALHAHCTRTARALHVHCMCTACAYTVVR